MSVSLLPSSAQGVNPLSLLEMGYGPSALRPTSDGVPVYTVGDQMWISSNYPEKVNVTIPVLLTLSNGSSAGSTIDSATLPPHTPILLLTFSQAYREGVWSLEVRPSSGAAYRIPLHFVKPSTHRIEPHINSSLLQNDSVSSSFAADLFDAYDVESCVPSGPASDRVLFPLPSTIGTGFLGVRRNGSSLFVSVNGTIPSPFTFWFELYHPYSFSITGTGELIMREMKSAESAPVLLQSIGGTNTTLLLDTQLRQGRSTMRAFFDNANGLVVKEASTLISDENSWLWLGPLCPVVSIGSMSFSHQTNLTKEFEDVPKRLYLMYRIAGVEAISSLPINLNVSKIVFAAAPWNATLSDIKVVLAVSRLVSAVSVSSSLSLKGIQTSVAGGTAYVMSSSYPVLINYSVSLHGETTMGQLTVLRPYSTSHVSVLTGELRVRVVTGGLPGIGVPVSLVRTETGVRSSKITDSGGVATFFVPGGDYTANASVFGETGAGGVRVVAGSLTGLTITLPANNYSIDGDSLQTILIIAAGVGVLVNLLLTGFRRRSRHVPIP